MVRTSVRTQETGLRYVCHNTFDLEQLHAHTLARAYTYTRHRTARALTPGLTALTRSSSILVLVVVLLLLKPAVATETN